jgi:hypothetical protein
MQNAVTSFIFSSAHDDLLAGIEAIAGLQGNNYVS